MDLTIQSHISTVAGYIRPSTHDNETAECAKSNSMAFSLEKHNNVIYYRGKPVTIFSSSWNRETGVLNLTINN